MKKIIIITLIAIIAVAGYANTHIYPQCAIIDNLDYKTDVVTCIDSVGFIWQFYGCEDYAIGDLVSFTMWDAFTEEIFDDTILDVRYSGYYFK